MTTKAIQGVVPWCGCAPMQQVVPNIEDSLRLVTKQSAGDKCVPTNNITLGRPAQPAYSPTSMLYPLTSIESFSDAGQSMDSIDANAMSASRLMTRDSGITAGGYTESDGAEEEEEELGLRRSSRSSGSRSKGSKQPKEKRKVGRCGVACAHLYRAATPAALCMQTSPLASVLERCCCSGKHHHMWKSGCHIWAKGIPAPTLAWGGGGSACV